MELKGKPDVALAVSMKLFNEAVLRRTDRGENLQPDFVKKIADDAIEIADIFATKFDDYFRKTYHQNIKNQN